MKSPALLLGLVLALGILPGVSAEETPPQPTVITAKFTEVKSSGAETIFILTGLVRVEATALVMTCDRLEIVALRSAKQLKELKGATLGDPDKFKSLIATGNVRIVQPGRVATCGRAEILPQENRITLEDHPFVELEDSTVAGDVLNLYRGEKGIEKIDGTGIKMTGPPIKDLSDRAPKTPKAPSPNSAAPAASSPPSAVVPDAPKITLPEIAPAPGKTPEKKP